jgi:post-segregation antitoxin (ccd killing protein)
LVAGGSVAARLINVRLAAEDEQLVRELRARGVSISDVVRRALRAEARNTAPAAIDAEALIAEMLERFPTPTKTPRRKRPNATDRRAVREHIVAQLRARR